MVATNNNANGENKMTNSTMTINEQINKMNFAIEDAYNSYHNADSEEETAYHSDRIDEMEEHRIALMDAASA